MAFDRLNLAPTGSSLTNKDVPTSWSYISSADTLATIMASAYFNDAAQKLTKDDCLYITGTDGSDWVNVTSVTGVTPVTVAEFISGATNPQAVIKFSGVHTTVGGAASEDITVAGILATDLCFVQMRVTGGAIALLKAITGTDKITLTFSADPAALYDVQWQVTRATT